MNLIDDEQLIDNEFRTKAIIDYIITHQECNKQKVVNYCTEKGYATRNPVMKILDDLEVEGILTVGRKRKNSKSLILTIDSENLLVLLPRDFEQLLMKVRAFVIAIKEWCKTPEIAYQKRMGFVPVVVNNKKITELTVPLVYFLMDIITEIYSIYFAFILPDKLRKNDQIIKLYSIYFSYITQMYALIIEELDEYVPRHNINLRNKSIPYATHIISGIGGTTNKVVSLIKTCNEYSIQKELLNILHFIWEKNIDIAYDQFTFGGKEIPQTEDTGNIDKSYLEHENPKLKAIFRSINFGMNFENRMWQQMFPKSKNFKNTNGTTINEG